MTMVEEEEDNLPRVLNLEIHICELGEYRRIVRSTLLRMEGTYKCIFVCVLYGFWANPNRGE